MKINCRHCGKRTRHDHRRLCPTCYADPRIESQYPSQQRFGLGNDAAVFEPMPTDAGPRSEEKITVMRRRLERRENLWHPMDASFADAYRAKEPAQGSAGAGQNHSSEMPDEDE